MKPSRFLLVVLALLLCSGGLGSDRAAQAARPLAHGLWVFSDEISDQQHRVDLIARSAAVGVTDLYVSVYQYPPNDAGRRMYEDAAIADLISRAHRQQMNVWAAYGAPDWPELGCDPAAFPLQRMAEVLAYNRAKPKATFDGVMLDVESENGSGLLALYECIRGSLPAHGRYALKLGAAIRFYWDQAVDFHGWQKPVYQHIIDMGLDQIVVMGYRDFAGPADCGLADGIICLDQDEIAYADSLRGRGNRTILVGLETGYLPGEPEKVTFYEEGLAALEQEAGIVAAHFARSRSFAGFAIHRYGAAYLSGEGGW